ncbi:MAG: ABC transporter ATP-binding protein [Sedimentisphaerales bacterium]|nr:ABC transporter ATP-binding protein [Sedimentisphaerales bacterium]
MTDNNTIVQISGLSKRFGATQALDAVDLEIRPGSIIGLLGANGAGKSTLLRHIIGLYLPDEGRCTTFGRQAKELGPEELGRIGYVHQEGELLDWMKAEQLIRYVSAYYPDWNTRLEREYIADFEVSLDARVGSLSPGQRQKLAILLAIGFEPDLLILDEPAAALDPVMRANFLDLLLNIIQDENRTVIISSHILSDVEKVIDHVVIMRTGRIVLSCGFDELRERFSKVRVSAVSGELPAELPFTNVLDCRRANGEAILTIEDCPAERLRDQAERLNCRVEIETLPLEDIYKIVVGQKTPVAGAAR